MTRPHDVESAAIAALSSLTGVRWATRVPDPRPDIFGRLTRIGGVQQNLVIEAPLLLVECWALDEVTAFDLAADAYGFFMKLGREGGWLGEAWVAQSRPASPITNYDPATDLPRFQFTVNLSVSMKES